MVSANEQTLLLFGGGFYFIASILGLFLMKTDIINKLKVFIGASKGAKIFRLYKKDGTEEEFVENAKPGGVIKHDGDVYAILRGTIFHNRAKNSPCITLVEGNLNSVDPFDEVDDRVDTKQLRALFFAEREKAKSDLNPDVKLLKLLVIGALIACGIAVVLGWLTFDNTNALKMGMTAAQVAKPAFINGTVVL